MRRSQHRRCLARWLWCRLDASRRAGRLFGSATLASPASRAQSRVRRRERAEGENRKRSRAQLVAYGGEARPRTAARPRSRASWIPGINRSGWIGRVGRPAGAIGIAGVVRARELEGVGDVLAVGEDELHLVCAVLEPVEIRTVQRQYHASRLQLARRRTSVGKVDAALALRNSVAVASSAPLKVSFAEL